MYTKKDLWRLWLELFWLEFDFKAKVFSLAPRGEELPIMAFKGRVRPTGVPFGGLRYMKGEWFYQLKLVYKRVVKSVISV